MAIALIVRFLFNRMGNRMTKVQDAAQPTLTLVLPHNIRLDLAGACNRVRRRSGFQCEHIHAALFEPCKKIRIVDDAILDDLSKSCGDLTRR